MVKFAFFSNYLNHHQVPFCREMNFLTNGSFNFVAQKAINEKRIVLGYKDISNDYDYVVRTYQSDEELKRAYKLADEAEYVLIGSSNYDYVKQRISKHKITFKYSERLFKEDIFLGFIRNRRRVYLNHKRYENDKVFMLCSSCYAAYDFNKYKTYLGKTYKWGYFPETITYDLDDLFSKKNNEIVSLLWVGRLIEYKHPEVIVELAKRLKQAQYKFVINVIGTGDKEEELKDLIKKNELIDDIKLLGSMSPEKVRNYMENTNIFLFTSDKQEGWGAVLNEAMNSGCACVASHAIGSVGFLIKHKQNGFIYKEKDIEDLFEYVTYLIDNPKVQKEIGTNAYKTISETWNAKIAAERLLELADCLNSGKDTPFSEGPCSKALPIADDDMYNYLVNENSRD